MPFFSSKTSSFLTRLFAKVFNAPGGVHSCQALLGCKCWWLLLVQALCSTNLEKCTGPWFRLLGEGAMLLPGGEMTVATVVSPWPEPLPQLPSCFRGWSPEGLAPNLQLGTQTSSCNLHRDATTDGNESHACTLRGPGAQPFLFLI